MERLKRLSPETADKFMGIRDDVLDEFVVRMNPNVIAELSEATALFLSGNNVADLLHLELRIKTVVRNSGKPALFYFRS